MPFFATTRVTRAKTTPSSSPSSLSSCRASVASASVHAVPSTPPQELAKVSLNIFAFAAFLPAGLGEMWSVVSSEEEEEFAVASSRMARGRRGNAAVRVWRHGGAMRSSTATPPWNERGAVGGRLDGRQGGWTTR